MANQRLYPAWAHLTGALRTGQPYNEARESGGRDVFAALYADPGAAGAFLDAMAAIQLGNFTMLAEQFDWADSAVPAMSAGRAGRCRSRSPDVILT